MSEKKHVVRQGAVVSDLHMLTNRTTVPKHMARIQLAAEECSLFVFNGDIFDFKWSLHDGFEASVAAASKWIEKLVTAHDRTDFVFILGNHDWILPYRDVLDGLSKRLPNVAWRADYYRVGDKLFLHGDACMGASTTEGLEAYRDRCNRSLKRSRLHHACYWAVASSGLPAVVLRMVPRAMCARRILAYLRNELNGELAEIRDIYFGHVHTPFTNFYYDGIRFHNTGSATKRLRLNVMRFGY